MYTEDEVDYLLDVYKKASNKQQVLTELSSQLGKSRRSIIGKLSRLGVYEKKVYLTKRGDVPVTKQELVHKLAIAWEIDLDSLEGLDKAPKAALQLLVNKFC